MSEEKLDIASEFSELTGTNVEVAHESAPNANVEDSQLENNVIDLTQTQEQPAEQETPVEMTQEEESPEELIESSLKSDETREEEYEQKNEEPEENDADSYDSYDATLDVLNEKYGTEYEDLDELLDDLEGEQGQGYASEQIAELNRFVSETGRSPEDYFKTQTQNYDEMSDSEVIKEYLSLENPDLTQKEIDLFFDSTYKQNEDKYNSEDNELGKIRIF